MSAYTEAQRRRALELVPTIGQAAAARELGIPPGTVSGWASRAKVRAPDNERTAAATEARKASCAERRAELAEALLIDAERLRRQLWEPCEMHSFGRGGFQSATLPEPDSRAKRELSVALAVCCDKAIALLKEDSGLAESLSAVDEWLREMKVSKSK